MSTLHNTTYFKDFSTSGLGGPGLQVTDSLEYVNLTSGSGNGIYFEFNSAGWLLLRNDNAASRTFTIALEEPTEYSKLGVTFTDKTYTVNANSIFLVNLDSRYKKADGYVYLDVSGSDCSALVIKRYTMS
jgi:hypothetical protein